MASAGGPHATMASVLGRKDGPMTAKKLIPVKMKEADMNLPEVQEFRCGDKPHETPLAEWIKVRSAEEIHGGKWLWLYRLESDTGPLVGYGSLTPGTIRTTEEDGSKKEVRGYEIP